jgi:putative ABC transport system ATP-binding protein
VLRIGDHRASETALGGSRRDLLETTVQPAITVKGVNHFFGREPLRKQILFGIDTEINAGEIVITMGPSGSGKTTLLTLVGALRSVQDGSVSTLGHELNGASRNTMMSVRKGIGFIFQAHNLLDCLTACENVQMRLQLDTSMSASDARRQSIEMLEAVGLGERVNHLPRQLSGGQKQRVAIARGLVSRPKVLLADEPTAALDKTSGREVVDILHRLAKQQGCAIMLVTHDNRILDIADRIITLEDGRLTASGTELARNAGNLMGALAQLHRSGDLVRHVASLPDAKFVETLEGVTSEFELLLTNLDAANQHVVEGLVAQVLEAVTIKIRDLLGAERGTIFVVDPGRGILWSKIALHQGEAPLDISIPLTKGIAGHVANTGQSVNIKDAYADARFDPATDRESGYHTTSVLCMPIRNRQQQIFAVVQLLNKRGTEGFTAKDEQTFAEFARPLAVILETCIRVATGPGAHAVPSDTR